MRNKLTWLVVLTCVALIGIITLQVFWLSNSYIDQRKHMLSDVEMSLLETQAYTGVNNSLTETAKNITNDIISQFYQKDTIAYNHSLLPPGHYSASSSQLNLDTASNTLAINLLKKAVKDIRAKDYSLQEYAGQLSKSFHTKGVTMPFELAIFAEDGSIINCTTDSLNFGKLNFKSNLALSMPVRLNQKEFGRLQVAFPDGRKTILRNIGIVLTLSVVLIIVCAFSFGFMIVLFFRQKKISEIRNDFMNNMTHELKTPISSVSLALELLQDETVPLDPHEKREYFHIAGNELKRLTLLVDKVLKMAAFEKSQVKIRMEKIQVKEWLEDMVSSFKPILEPLDARVSISIFPDEMQMTGDKIHLSNVMQNLMDNAIKYRDKQKGEISLQLNAWESEEGKFISIKDNGMGIPYSYQEKVFEKFFRVPTGDEHDTKGYGLGLSYVQEIIHLHDGIITVESTFGVGTRFKMTFPKN